MRYLKHVFVCTNQRDPSDPRGCCGAKGSDEIRDALKKEVKQRGLHRSIRINAAGCLDACEFGPSIVVYPDCVWYGGVTAADIDEIIESHLVNDIPVARLLIKDPRYLGPIIEPDAASGDDNTTTT